MTELRQYQKNYLEVLRNEFKNKNMKVLLHLATGGGKSVIFKQIVKNALEKNKKVMFIVYGTSILDQAAKKHFAEITDDFSVMQGGRKFESASLSCCSISTLARRTSKHDELISENDLFIIDEAHNCTSKSYRNFLDKIPADKMVIGFTATPYLIGNKAHTYWDKAVKEISVSGLVEQKFLMNPRVFSVPLMNTKVKKQNGDFKNDELFEANDELKIYSNIIKEYEEKAKGLRSICFAINVQHSLNIARAFQERGYRAAHADADTPLDEREYLINKLGNGELDVLCNVNIFSTGIDIPEIECGLMARPTHSKVLWIQQVGRVLRIHPNNRDCKILDFGANATRLGHPLEDFEAELVAKDKKEKKEQEEKENEFKSCPSCYFILPQETKVCPECEHEFKGNREIQQEEEIRLEEILLQTKKVKWENPYKKWWRESVLTDKLEENPLLHYSLESFYDRAEKWSHKTNSLYFKMWEKHGSEAKKIIKFPYWFLKTKQL